MRRKTYRSRRIKSEINLTPLIDVMTSLLAIFMITAPMLTSGINLDLPKGDGRSIDAPDKTVDIGVTERGKIYLGKEIVSENNLLKKMRAIVRENPNIRIIISGDRHADYGQVIEVMALLRAAGFTQVSLKTDARVKSIEEK